MDKKEISAKTAVRGLINGFISYGVLISFIFLAISMFITWQVTQYKEYVDYDTLKYTLPAIGAFIIFFLIHATCQLSTFDLFKKCRVEKKDINKISEKMNLFFILCALFFIILNVVLINVKFDNQAQEIENTKNLYYSAYSDDYAEYLTLNMIYDFQTSRIVTLFQTLILEVGLILGLFSLITSQKKLIERYNYIPKHSDEVVAEAKVN